MTSGFTNDRSSDASGTGDSARGPTLRPESRPGSGRSTHADTQTGGPSSTGLGEPGPGIRPASRPDGGPPGAGVQAVQQPGSGLGLVVSIAVAAVVLVLAFYAAGEADNSRLPIAQTTTPLFWLIAAAAIALAAGGAVYAERTADRAAAAVGRPRRDTALATAWTVPAIATTAAVLLVATYHNAAMLVAGPLIAFLGNAGALLSRDLLDDAADTTLRTATVIHTLVIHAVAFLALSAVYLNKMPTPVSAPLVAVIGGLLALETFERGAAERQTRLLYAGLVGWVMAQATIALNWWQTHGWTGGALLLVCFYLAAGVLLARTQRSVLRGRDVLEFGAVSLLAFAVLVVTA